MNTLKQNKAIIRDWMAANYTDAKLVELLDHARAGKLAFLSCCCFIGIPTATHELQEENMLVLPDVPIDHYYKAENLPGSKAAEKSYHGLAIGDDPLRRRILIPMVLAEIRRRAKAAQPAPNAEHLEVSCS